MPIRSLVFIIAGSLIAAATISAQEPVKSLGQPPRFKPYGGATVGVYRPGSQGEFSGTALIGIRRDLTNPLAGLLSVKLEAYGGIRGGAGADGGVRSLLFSPFFGVQGGVDFNFRDTRADVIFSLTVPIQRGGIFRTGGLIRGDWLPTRGNSFSLGFELPIAQPYKGRSRPSRDEISLPRTPWISVPPEDLSPALAQAMSNVQETAHWVNRLTTPFFDYDGKDHAKAMEISVQAITEIQEHLADTDPLFPEGRTAEAEVLAYHAELERAFSIAASGRDMPIGGSTPLGRELADEAKNIILTTVIYPYNRLLGQRKRDEPVLELAMAAQQRFEVSMASRGVTDDRAIAVRYVFTGLIDVIERERTYSRDVWQDTRLTWIPLQYALRPEQHDTQAELDEIVEQSIGVEFSKGNDFWYIYNAQFQWELWRMIREAEDYHVLWIHDYRFRNNLGEPDRIATFQTVEAYFAAMTRRVQAYDQTETFPTYMILLDQHYYEINGARFWMDLLENPLEHEVKFPRGFDSLATAVSNAQAELRRAVAESRRLQAEAGEHGEDWLASLIKVHINITNPSDFSFLSSGWIPALAFPDNIMRDHRKLAFYDVTEDDPYRGMAIYTGVGIGEHYVGPTWEDRSIMVQGPAILTLKHAARQLLLNQGMDEEDIPPPLVPRPKPANYDALVRSQPNEPWSGRAMQLHNQTGYREKPINVFKAITYSLMPKGSILKIPDSLWNSPFLSGLLVGMCLRGGNVYLLAPSLENAPSSGFPQMSRSYELLARLVHVQEILGDKIAAAGGDLRIGLYDTDLDVTDIPGRLKAWRDRVEETPFLRELYSALPNAVFELADSVESIFPDWDVDHRVLDDTTRKPKLHIKANLFISPEGWEGLLARPEWPTLLRQYIEDRARVDQAQNEYQDPNQSIMRLGVGRRLVEGFLESLDPESRERVAYYLIVGSQNQDYRGMFMDGEVGVVLSGYESLIALIDFMFLFGSATWVDDLETLERLLPPYSEFQRRLGRLLQAAL